MSDTPATTSVLHMIGDVDIATEGEWRRRGDELLASHPDIRDVTVDLAQVGFLDSRGMAVLVNLHKQALERGGTLTLLSVPRRISRALAVAGLDQIFQLDAS